MKRKKVSEGTETPLKGAKFVLTGKDTKTAKEYTTDDNGIIHIEGLLAYAEGKNITGEYTLHESEAPEGYSNNRETINFS